MKILLFVSVFLFSYIGYTQTYAPYTGNKANESTISKPDTLKKGKPKQASAEKAVEKPKGDFQDLMNKAVEQSKAGKYKNALSLYTQALDVSTDETAWRALVSRASVYTMMKDYNKSIADLTTIIDDGNAPEKQLANIYLMRARAQMSNKNKSLACNDVQKAKELGMPASLAFGIDCN